LIELAAQVRFRSPLVRSAIYRAATLAERQTVHRALAEATDTQADPDRRAWHRAQAALGADEDLAAELERSADRARARGGLAAAAAFLERAARSHPTTARRARRALAAAQAKYLAGSPQAALTLLERAASAPMDALEVAMAQRLRGRIALHVGRSGEGAPVLFDAAQRLESLDPGVARETHLEALHAAAVAGRLGLGMRTRATAARTAPAAPGRSVARTCCSMALRQVHGRRPRRRSDPQACTGRIGRRERGRRGGRALAMARVSRRGGRVRRRDLASAGQPIRTDRAQSGRSRCLADRLMHLSLMHVFEGKLDTAAALVEEIDSIIDATGSRLISVPKLMLAACRGDEARASALIDEVERRRVLAKPL